MALSLALDLIGGPVFDGLSASVSRAMDRDAAFTDLLQHMDHTLKSLKNQAGVISEIQQYNVELGLSTIEIMRLSTEMDDGRKLVERLSRIKFRLWNFFCCCTSNCAEQLRKLNRELGSLFATLQLELIRDIKEILILQRQNRDDFDKMKVMLEKILQKIDDPEVKGLLKNLVEQNSGGSMETSTLTPTSSSGSNTEDEGNGVTQAASFEGLVQEAFRLLINTVKEAKESSMMFKPLLLRLKSTLDCLRPFIEEMAQDNKVLDHPEEKLEKLRIQMENGVNLIRKCSSVCRWTSNKKDKYTKQVLELDEFLQGQLRILTVKVARDVKGTSELIRNIKEVVKRIEGSDMVQNQDEFQGSCDITEPPIPPVEFQGSCDITEPPVPPVEFQGSCDITEPPVPPVKFQGSCDITEPPVPQERMPNFSVDETVTVGLDVPLKELKRELLNDGESSMLVLTGPAGCGKTTLAKTLCQDDEVKVSTVEGTRDVEETMISIRNTEAGVKPIEESGVVQNQLETKGTKNASEDYTLISRISRIFSRNIVSDTSRSAGTSLFSEATTSTFRSKDDQSTEGLILETSNLRVFSYEELKNATREELKNATRNFMSEQIHGEGSFGRVFKGWLDEKTLPPCKAGTGMMVAIKKWNPEIFQGFEEWQSGVNFLGRLSHPHLVKLLGYCREENELLLVYEYMQKGSLENHLFINSLRAGNPNIEPLSWDIRIKIAIGAARGLAFLHSSEKQIIYRDFKASNILLDVNYNAKLSDFGLVELGPTGGDSHESTRVMGTYGYAAPEYIATGQLSVKSDVYGFGVVLLEILTGLRALDSKRPSGQHYLVNWTKPLLSHKRKLKTIMDARIEGQYSFKAALQTANITLKCLAPDPQSRPSIKEVSEELEQIQAIRENPKPSFLITSRKPTSTLRSYFLKEPVRRSPLHSRYHATE